MSCYDLSKAFLAFANHKQPFTFGNINLTASQVKRINAIMQTCGFYDEAGEFSYLVGLPGKKWCGRWHSGCLSVTLFGSSMEPEIKPERKLGYGNQGVGAADHTDTRVYFLKIKVKRE